jgi:hypothetical protein
MLFLRRCGTAAARRSARPACRAPGAAMPPPHAPDAGNGAPPAAAAPATAHTTSAPPRRRRRLVAFDFDHTIADANSDTFILGVLPGGLPADVKDSLQPGQWTAYMQVGPLLQAPPNASAAEALQLTRPRRACALHPTCSASWTTCGRMAPAPPRCKGRWRGCRCWPAWGRCCRRCAAGAATVRPRGARAAGSARAGAARAEGRAGPAPALGLTLPPPPAVDAVILSDSNSLFIEWALDAWGHAAVFGRCVRPRALRRRRRAASRGPMSPPARPPAPRCGRRTPARPRRSPCRPARPSQGTASSPTPQPSTPQRGASSSRRTTPATAARAAPSTWWARAAQAEASEGPGQLWAGAAQRRLGVRCPPSTLSSLTPVGGPAVPYLPLSLPLTPPQCKRVTLSRFLREQAEAGVHYDRCGWGARRARARRLLHLRHAACSMHLSTGAAGAARALKNLPTQATAPPAPCSRPACQHRIRWGRRQ